MGYQVEERLEIMRLAVLVSEKSGEDVFLVFARMCCIILGFENSSVSLADSLTKELRSNPKLREEIKEFLR